MNRNVNQLHIIFKLVAEITFLLYIVDSAESCLLSDNYFGCVQQLTG